MELFLLHWQETALHNGDYNLLPRQQKKTQTQDPVR